jgi:hypothetical protein
VFRFGYEAMLKKVNLLESKPRWNDRFAEYRAVHLSDRFWPRLCDNSGANQ